MPRRTYYMTMLRYAAAATLAIASLSCGSSLREIDGQAGAAGATATPSPAATTGLPVGSPAAGWVRISDDAGGWSMDMPQGWFERAAPQHGREFRSYDPSIPLPGNYSSEGLPPVGDVLVRMQMQANPDKLDAATFFKVPDPREVGVQVREHKQATVAGQPTEFWSLWRSQPAQFQRQEPTLWWYLRSPYFDDRMLVIYAAPGESPLRSEVERIVASLRFYRPSPVSLLPTVSRQEAIDRVVLRPPGKPSTATRVEAKLVQYKDWERRQGSRSYTTDPDTLVWVVAYVAPDITTRRGDPCAWAISVSAARPLAPGDGVGVFQCGPGTWPAWFDQLVDLDK